jgi:SEC-C motif-containing protein
MRCPCGSDLEYAHCCGPYLGGEANPPTAEALMRSRYTAYTRGDIDYIANTLAAERRDEFDPAAAKAWATQSQWLGLRIVSTEAGLPEDQEGIVSFVATYAQDGRTIAHHEVSQFRRGEGGAWRFVSGDADARAVDQQPRASAPPAVRSTKVGRNDPCPCGSGRKYKKCCAK